MAEYINREISWLSFNERVLQEAQDESNPLIERLRFLGIFSNNRDEFFRVRIASIKRMLMLGKKTREKLYTNPKLLLKEIERILAHQEVAFELTFKDILKGLEKNGIQFVNEKELTSAQENFVISYFKETVRPDLVPLMLTSNSKLEVTDNASFLAIKLYNEGVEKKTKYALIEIPSEIIPRFLVIPGESTTVMFLDDVIRLGLKEVFRIFDFERIESFAVKLTRDAELDIEEELDESLIEKLAKSVHKRKKAEPVRFIYDEHMPEDLLQILNTKLDLSGEENILSQRRYHNFKDLISFPNLGKEKLIYPKRPANKHPELNDVRSLLNVIRKKDILLNYPFQDFTHTIDILREAAIDPSVTSIKITLYRVAKDSKILNTLINASKNDKKVTVVIELRARFDESHNIHWAKELQDNGVNVIFGVQGLKVHSKVILIERKKKKEFQYIGHVGTGNFNENTATVFSDLSLWTADERITKDLSKLFDFFEKNYKNYVFKELLVSPFNARQNIHRLIDVEIANHRAKKEASILIKLNNLVDEELIKKLYAASNAGVKIKLIIRGICSLKAGVKGMSENIEVISVLGRYLDHSRIMIFANGGEEKCFIGSADWMVRNMDKRIEVIAPIYDPTIIQTIKSVLNYQLKDNVKSRILDEHLENKYKRNKAKELNSQIEIYDYYKKMDES
ncbi:MAG TPA: polyphosphate kinase 1 [Crocinitomicaceae bacterium]|nr:polyphosphate kinase 1 [Crocinitomicaceae bacterium]